VRVELPDVNFDIAVDYPDETGICSWEVTISMGGVPLIARQYKDDFNALRAYRETHDYEDPHWYARDSDHAKEKCTTEFGHELKRALSAGSAMTLIGGTT
jgi:hypothetical protein